jgi:hypothetical protein
MPYTVILSKCGASSVLETVGIATDDEVITIERPS